MIRFARAGSPLLLAALLASCGHAPTKLRSVAQVAPGNRAGGFSDGQDQNQDEETKPTTATQGFEDLSFQIPASERLKSATVQRDGLEAREIYVFGTPPEEADTEIFIVKITCPDVWSRSDLRQFVTANAQQATQNGVEVLNGVPSGIRTALGTSGDVHGFYFDMLRPGQKSYERQMILKNLRLGDDTCISVKANALDSAAQFAPDSLAATTLNAVTGSLQYGWQDSSAAL